MGREIRLNFEYDRAANAGYLKVRAKNGPARNRRCVAINETLNIHLDDKGRLTGVEFLNPSESAPKNWLPRDKQSKTD